jgi:predicted O-methyltransferase YrrM
VTRYRRLLRLAPFIVVAAAAVAGAALLGAPAAAAVIGGLLGLIFAVARDTRNRLISATRDVQRLERQMRADAERQRADAERQRADAERQRADAERQRTELDRLGDRVAAHIQTVESGVQRTVASSVNALRQGAQEDFRQLESLANLFALFELKGAVPPSRDFAASPDLLHTYVGEILSRRPSLVVECGSGLSTLWAAYALERSGGEGRVIALENDEYYAEKTRVSVAAHGLSHRAEVRHAAILDVKAGGSTQPWYNPDRIADLYAVDVLFVDGPTGSLAPQSRYPALPVFRDRLSPGAVILLDDAGRDDEKAITERWRDEFPELEVHILPHEKGTALFRVPTRTDWQPTPPRRGQPPVNGPTSG